MSQYTHYHLTDAAFYQLENNVTWEEQQETDHYKSQPQSTPESFNTSMTDHNYTNLQFLPESFNHLMIDR